MNKPRLDPPPGLIVRVEDVGHGDGPMRSVALMRTVIETAPFKGGRLTRWWRGFQRLDWPARVVIEGGEVQIPDGHSIPLTAIRWINVLATDIGPRLPAEGHVYPTIMDVNILLKHPPAHRAARVVSEHAHFIRAYLEAEVAAVQGR